MYIDYLAKRVADSTIGSANPNLLNGLPDESLLELVKTAAASETILLLQEIVNERGKILQQFGMTTSHEEAEDILNSIGEIIMSDKVLIRAVDLLKEIRQVAQ